MVFLLFLGSVICIVAGAAMVAFGIPVKEFSFGDTLISGGVTAIVGGLVLFGLGLAVIQLQRIMDALSARPPVRVGRAVEPFEPHAVAGERGGHVPFPSRPRAERRASEAFSVEPERPAAADAAEVREHPVHELVPTMRNPDEPPIVAEGTNAPLSPQEALTGTAAGTAESGDGQHAKSHAEVPGVEAGADQRADTTRDRDHSMDWRSPTSPGQQPQKAFFDAMWPAESRSPKPAAGEESSAAEAVRRTDSASESESTSRTSAGEPRAVAILKSGIVDGMGYTLYVDGSIEAELPDGKLRFASINELRSYLEKNS